jgi:hypothetical protein
MLNKRYAGMFVAAIIAIVVIWARLFHPIWDYYPPERLLNTLERSWFVTAGVRDLAFFVYIVVALGMMTLFFSICTGCRSALFGRSGFSLAGPFSGQPFMPRV